MKAFVFIKKEYKNIVKKKSFIVSTILTPILMAVMMFLPALLMKMGKGERTIAVADFTGTAYAELVKFNRHKPKKPQKVDVRKAMEANSLREEESKLKLIAIPTTGKTVESIAKEYEKKILDKEIDGFVIIPADIKQNRKIALYANNIADFSTNRFFTSSLRTLVSKDVLLEKHIDPAVVLDATRDIDMDTFRVTKQGTARSASFLDYMMSLLMMVILFVMLISYGQLLMRGVIEEKNSRVVEVLISSARTSEMFYGKILGIGLAGLTQIGIWLVLGLALVGNFTGNLDSSITSFFSPEIALYFVVFFVLGYFMYSIPYAMVGAAVNTDQEAQQLAQFVIWMMMIPYFIGFTVTQNPNSLIAVVCSLIPVFSPILMFMRITTSMPPLWQILLSIFGSTLTIWLFAWIGAKIFRVGILMYGKRPSFKEIFRWFRYST